MVARPEPFKLGANMAENLQIPQRMRFLTLITLCVLTACARPNIEIDTSELRTSASQPAVGLLEVHRANSGGSLGIALGEAMGESAFCTATLLGGGEIVTSSDCVRGKDGDYDTKQMQFHFKHANGNQTEHHEVQSIARVDPERNLAWLLLRERTDAIRSMSIRSSWKGDEESGDSVPVMAVSIPAPNSRGATRVRISQVTVEYAVASLPPPPPPVSDAPASLAETDANEEKTTPSVAAAAAEKPAHPLSRPRGISVKGLKDETWGAPLFYREQMVGVVKSAKRGKENAHWIVGP